MPLCSIKAAGPVAVCLPVTSTRRWVMLRSIKARKGWTARAPDEDFAGAAEEWNKWFDADPSARQGAKMPVRIAGMKVPIAMIAEA